MDKGFTAASTVSGAPIVMDGGDSPEEEWRPEDYSRKFYGPTRLRKALAQSLNLVAVRLLRALGITYTVEYLQRFGFDPAKTPRNLSLALGTVSATPLQMANAFAVFANGGHLVTPYFIARVEDANHTILEQARPAVICPECESSTTDPSSPSAQPASPPPPAPAIATAPDPNKPVYAPRVLSPETSFLMTSMMQDVIRAGTGRGAQVLGRKDLAGKTGTTNDYRDAWFSGFNSEVVTTAWIGFDQPVSLGRAETGGRTALPVWIDFMRVALEGIPEKPLIPPETMVRIIINSETGKPTAPDDPQAMEEYFVEGTETPQPLPGLEGEPTQESTPQKVPENIREKLF